MEIIVQQFMSLDGVVQAPGAPDEDRDGGFEHGGWVAPHFDPEGMGPAIDEALQRADALLFGRRTWRVMADAWPGRAGDPFADRMNALGKHVASRTLSPADMDWNSELLDQDDAVGAIRALKEGGDGTLLVVGSPSLSTQLLAAGLVDELFLMVFPVLLGGGKGIWPSDGAQRPFELVASDRGETGVLVLRYRAAAASA
jgi:dihydrofolate reductase